MARINYYKLWCPTHNKWVYQWSPTTPTMCPENIEHAVDPNTYKIINYVDDSEKRPHLVKGSQDTLLYSELDINPRHLMFETFPGSKFEVEYVMLAFHEDLIDTNSYSFELVRSMDLTDPTNPYAPDKQDVIVSQVYYHSLKDMFGIANKVEHYDGVYRLYFTWGTSNDDSPRLPFFVESKWNDRVLVYTTSDDEHRMPTFDNPSYGIGSDPLDYFEWYAGIPGSFRIFHPYTRHSAEELINNAASYPESTPMLKRVFSVSFRGTRLPQD